MLSPAPSDLFAGANLTALLGRPLRAIPVADGMARLAGARVLVTGAGGSVGSALISQLAPLGLERVIALDLHEASLFRLWRDAPPALPLELELADVRNAAKLIRLFTTLRPHVVIHLAAYKHVPMGERSPEEPVSVNVFGTEAVAQAAIAAGVAHLVYPSSDKAVNPPSVYGGTKRLAEALLHQHAAAQRVTAIHIVRYVNIIGSSGSALETFAAQARAGAPLTITDGRMTRYWMAMDEAIALCWHALGLPSGSHTLLDVGKPTPVRSLAARVAGLVQAGGPAPRLVETGARPGERLFEELASATERLIRCGDDPVWRVLRVDQRHDAVDVSDLIERLRSTWKGDDLDELRHRVMEFSQLLQ
jgi:FlaA1/EpsC-like NDP-sugar epimerase